MSKERAQNTNVKRFAKRIIHHVVVTARGDDAEYIKQLGADQVIDYKTEACEDRVKDFDAV